MFGRKYVRAKQKLSDSGSHRVAEAMAAQVPGSTAEGFETGQLGAGSNEHAWADPGPDDGFDESWVFGFYPDVAAAVAQKMFDSGLAHYQAFGRAEGRHGSAAHLAAEAAKGCSIPGNRDALSAEDRQTGSRPLVERYWLAHPMVVARVNTLSQGIQAATPTAASSGTSCNAAGNCRSSGRPHSAAASATWSATLFGAAWSTVRALNTSRVSVHPPPSTLSRHRQEPCRGSLRGPLRHDLHNRAFPKCRSALILLIEIRDRRAMSPPRQRPPRPAAREQRSVSDRCDAQDRGLRCPSC